MQQPSLKIAPSLLSADFSRLADQVQVSEAGGADWHHCDIMDGHFVPNITFGPLILKAVKKVATKPLDVHFMITDPLKYIDPFVDAGADYITFHVEIAERPEKVIEAIRAKKIGCGITLRPSTPFDRILPFIQSVDMVLIMTVEPGFGGQKIIREVFPNIRRLRELGFKGELQIDGGISLETIQDVVALGANNLVAGSAVYGSPDPAGAVRALKAKAAAVLKS